MSCSILDNLFISGVWTLVLRMLRQGWGVGEIFEDVDEDNNRFAERVPFLQGR